MTNNLIKRVLSAGKRSIRNLAFAGGLAASTMLPMITGCGDTGGSGGGNEPLDSPVVWTGEYATSATENSAFSSGSASAFDPDGYPLEYTKIAGPAFLNVHPIFGTLYGTPTDADVGANQQVIIRATDGTMPTDKTFYLTVANVEDINGNVSDVLTGTDISGATVSLGTKSAITNASGDYTLDDVLDGDYQVQVTSTGFYDHNAGKLTSSQAKRIAGKLANIDFELIPTTYNMAFFNETCRSCDGTIVVGAGAGKTQRITDEDCANWNGYINTNNAFGSGTPITPANITVVQNIIENDWPTKTRGKLNPTVLNGRLQIGTNPPTYGTALTSLAYWNDTLPANDGIHAEGLKNINEIAYNGTSFNTTQSTQAVQKHELTQCLGVRCDSTLGVPSIWDGTTTDFTQVDNDTLTILYSRPCGNTNPDNNSSDYQINP